MTKKSLVSKKSNLRKNRTTEKDNNGSWNHPITLEDVYECGRMAFYCLPDVFDDPTFNLSSSEATIMRKIWSRSVHAFKTLSKFEKSIRKSTFYWNGKQKMAEECGLSYPTFRNGVRSLHELGFLTTMEIDENDKNKKFDEIDKFKVGIMHEAFNFLIDLYWEQLSKEIKSIGTVIFPNTEKNFRLSCLLLLMYNKNVVTEIQKINNKIHKLENRIIELQKQNTEYKQLIDSKESILPCGQNPSLKSCNSEKKTEKGKTEGNLDTPTAEWVKREITGKTKHTSKKLQKQVAEHISSEKFEEVDEKIKALTDEDVKKIKKTVVDNISNIEQEPITDTEKEPVIFRIPIFSSEEKRLEFYKDYPRQPIQATERIVGGLTRAILLEISLELNEICYWDMTAEEQEIALLVSHYENKVRAVMGYTGFRSLSKKFREHKNWKFYVRIYKMLKKHNIKYRYFFASQFERVKYWKHKQEYPYLAQICSEKALKSYEIWMDIERKKANNGTKKRLKDIKVKEEKALTLKQEIEKKIESDVREVIILFRRIDRMYGEDIPYEFKKQEAILELANSRLVLSPYYLASVDWYGHTAKLVKDDFVKAVAKDSGIPESEVKLNGMIQDVVDLAKVSAAMRKKYGNLILDCVAKYEKKYGERYNLPATHHKFLNPNDYEPECYKGDNSSQRTGLDGVRTSTGTISLSL